MIIQFKKLWTKTIFLNRISYEMEEILVVSFPICRERYSHINIGFKGKGCCERHTLGRLQFSSKSGWMESVFLSQNNTETLGHLIREVDAFMNTDQGSELSEEFYNMFNEVKKSFKSENIDDHKSMKNTYEERMEELVKSYDPY